MRDMNAESTVAQREFLTRVKAAKFDDALDLLDSLVANSIQVGYKAGYDQGHADGYGEGLDFARSLENTRLSQ